MKSTAHYRKSYSNTMIQGNIGNQELKKAIIGNLFFIVVLILTGLVEGV